MLVQHAAILKSHNLTWELQQEIARLLPPEQDLQETQPFSHLGRRIPPGLLEQTIDGRKITFANARYLLHERYF